MSLYNTMNGFNRACFFILPMLGKHPDEYPRFRDCFAGVAKNHESETDQFGIPRKTNDLSKPLITVYTRTGGGNRESYQEQNGVMQASLNFVEDYDDDFDSTFAYWVFNVPDQFIDDYKIMTDAEDPRSFRELSEGCKKQIIEVYPKLKDELTKLLYE